MLFSKKAELTSEQQDVAKQADDLLVKVADKGRESRKVRSGVSGKNHEDDVAATGFGESSAGEDALVVAVEHDRTAVQTYKP